MQKKETENVKEEADEKDKKKKQQKNWCLKGSGSRKRYLEKRNQKECLPGSHGIM